MACDVAVMTGKSKIPITHPANTQVRTPRHRLLYGKHVIPARSSQDRL